MRARNTFGTSAWSGSQSATPLVTTASLPGIPPSFTAAESTTTVRAVDLDWGASTNSPTSYEYRWRTAAVGMGNPGAWQGPTTGITETEATKSTGLTGGVEYDFQVRARNAAGASNWSGSRQARPYGNLNPPSIRPTFTVDESTDTAGAVDLDWDASSNRPASYEYRWRTAAVGSGNPGTWRGPETGITDTEDTKEGLTGGVQYDFQLRSRNVFARAIGRRREKQRPTPTSTRRVFRGA